MTDSAQVNTDVGAVSREIRVFLSSTFRDFNEERKLLATQVFPELNRRARERGVELVEVDLRWGVTQEQAEDGHALEICLAEIERCQRYFIGMLGDSYGSLTPPERDLLVAAPELLEQHSWLNGKIGQASYTELEMEQRLQQMGGNANDGRAFFYFRDPAYSNPRADAGEQGWRSDDPSDRQKLEALRRRIKTSGYPVVEGLPNPKGMADRIKDDLWALIERLFPEGEQPEALEKEARKHTDYRRSRSGPGQYIGGEAYIQQLEQLLAEGEQQILITGQSGSGKSALIANWMERHSQCHPADALYGHHLGCTNDANAVRPMLGRLIDTASQQLLDAEVIAEALAVPEDWWELVAKVAETLKALGEWCQSQGRHWIWVLDGLDRLDPDEQNALPWLPQTLPDGVQVVASALACPAREILSERGYTSLTIEPLATAEQEQLIQRYLKRYTKELGGGLRQQILNHPLAGSPLFLRVLLEELRQCGRHDTLQQQLAFYLSSQTVDDLYERVLERVENDGSGESVRKVMTALWASRAGLSETELLAITDLKPLQWAPIDLALQKAFGRNGNRLVFDHDYLRIAVEDRYLPTDEERHQAHSVLADWHENREGWDERDSEELPWQLQHANRLGDLRNWLLKPWALACLQWDRGSRESINYWLIAKADTDGELDELIAEAVEEEIEERKEDAADQIWFVDRIAALLAEAGLYRDLLLRLRTLSLELEEATDNREEASLLSSMAWLASAHQDMGNYAEAEPLYLRCLEARERLLGTEHPDTLTTVGNLGLLYSNKGDYEQAEAYYQRCLEAQERRLGPEHPSTNGSRFSLASLLSDQERYAESIPLRRLELVVAVKRDGREAPCTLTSIHRLAEDLYWADELKESEQLYREALAGRIEYLGDEDGATMASRYGLARCLSAQKRHTEAIPLRRQELAWCRETHGDTDTGTLESINELAIDLRESGDLEEAEALFRELLAGRQEVLEPKDFGIGRALGGLAKTLENAGKLEEAAACRQKSLDHRVTHEGSDTWWANSNRLDLARVMHKLHLSAEAQGLLVQLQESMSTIDEPDQADKDLSKAALELLAEISSGMDVQCARPTKRQRLGVWIRRWMP